MYRAGTSGTTLYNGSDNTYTGYKAEDLVSEFFVRKIKNSADVLAVVQNGISSVAITADNIYLDANRQIALSAGSGNTTSAFVVDGNSVTLNSNTVNIDASQISIGNSNVGALFDTTGGEILLKAGNVKIDANTVGVTNLLEGGAATFKGAVEAKSFKVTAENETTHQFTNTAIEFTTYDPTGEHSAYTGMASSGLDDGDPVAIIYDLETNTPKYFFDFAPVNLGTFSADAEVTYSIVSAAGAQSGSGKVDIKKGDIIYKVTDSGNTNYNKYVGLPKSNAAVLNSSSKDYYEYSNILYTTLVYESATQYLLTPVCVYKGFNIINGAKSYNNKYYIINKSVASVTGNNIQSYKPQSL
jgi:hypothetical protein